MAGRWFRFYDSVVDDPKVQRLPDAAFRAWINLMCIASKNAGTISADIADISFALRVTPGKARDLLQVLQSAGLIERFETGYTPHNWSTRQYDSDSSAERMRRHRAKTVTVDVTSHVQESDAVDSEVEQNREEQKEETSIPPQAAATEIPPLGSPKPVLKKRKTQMPEGWPGEADQAWAEDYWRERSRHDLTASMRHHIAECRDKHLSLGTMSADWPATWRTWAQNAVKYNKPERTNGHGRPPSAHEKFLRGAALSAGYDLGNAGSDEGANRPAYRPPEPALLPSGLYGAASKGGGG